MTASVTLCSSFGCNTYTARIDSVTNNGDGSVTVGYSMDRSDGANAITDVTVSVYVDGRLAGSESSNGRISSATATTDAQAGDTVELVIESPGHFGSPKEDSTTATVPAAPSPDPEPEPDPDPGGGGDDGTDGAESPLDALEPITRPITSRTSLTHEQAAVVLLAGVGAAGTVYLSETQP